MRPPIVTALWVAGLLACGPTLEERWPRDPVYRVQVAMACYEDPTFLGDWFPKHSLKMPIEEPAASNPDEVERRVGHRRCEAGAIARAYQEPVLARGSPIETYRLFWSPSFSPPVIIRLEDRPEGVMVTLKRDQGLGEQLTGSFDVIQRRVGRQYLVAVRAVAEAAGCWTPGHTCGAETSVRPGILVTDGEEWLIEGVRWRDHWGVVVGNPFPPIPGGREATRHRRRRVGLGLASNG